MRRTAFALVLSLLLVVLLTTTGAGLALTAAAESAMTASVARDLDHTLAVDSFLACLPQLMKANGQVKTEMPDRRDVRRFSLAFGHCQIDAELTPEQHKHRIGLNRPSDGLLPELRAMARTHGLPERNVRLRPIVDQQNGRGLPPLVWFDQIVEPTQLEEVFHLGVPAIDVSHTDRRPSWSDLISFWHTDSRQTYAIEMETRVQQDARRWYVVVSLTENDVQVHYRGAVG